MQCFLMVDMALSCCLCTAIRLLPGAGQAATSLAMEAGQPIDQIYYVCMQLNATLLTAHPVGSPAYNTDLAITRELGGANSNRSAEQDRIARSW